MLAALARAGHGVELNQIHRFSHAWERPASLALRDGTPGALAAYRLAGRLHPCEDGDTALDGVFAHWAAARAQGQDALMLARTRLDVDALNLRARAAALAAGEVAGPVTVAGQRQWQAGDLLRARRNDRRLTVGDGHVRNGDRYRVLGPGSDGALLVEDLSGRGRTILPATYLAEHADYGWASTIDGAQGATADVGIVLARPGLDREHLYVAMTRGRHANHAYITPDPSTDDDHHDHPHTRHPAHAEADPQEQAERVLQAALTRSGAQDAAHTALEHARTQAAHTARQNERRAERAAARERAAAQRQRRQDRPLTAEHARPSVSSTNAGPNATSSAPIGTRYTAACSRPRPNSKRCRAGPATAAAPSPTPSPAASRGCTTARRPRPAWTPRSTGSPAKSPTTPASASPATSPHRTAHDRTDGISAAPANWSRRGRLMPTPTTGSAAPCRDRGSPTEGPNATPAAASAAD
jgi:hypothetical protein